MARPEGELSMTSIPNSQMTRESIARLTFLRFMSHKMAVACGIFLIVMIVLAGLASVIEAMIGLDSNEVDLFNRFSAPSADHILGTDELGRDMFLRMLHGGQVSLLVGLVTALLAAVIGTAIGLPAGYFGGWADALLMRFTDSIIALPILPLLIVVAAADLSKIGLPDSLATGSDTSLFRIIFIIGLVGWTTVARLVRGATLSLRERDFVLAARAQGAGPVWIMVRHILPNAISPIVVATTLSVGNIILLESVLSFLGLGIQPPIASWGNMLTNAQDMIYEAPALAIFPGFAIFLTVVSFNFLGDGLQDALDPKALQR